MTKIAKRRALFISLALIILTIGVLAISNRSSVLATNTCGLNSGAVSGARSISSSCEISSDAEGVDGGSLTIPSGKTITIDSDAMLVISPGSEIKFTDNSSQIIVNKSRSISAVVKGSLCAVDADGDGYAAKITRYSAQAEPIFPVSSVVLGTSACPSGYTKKGSLNSGTQLDCWDNNASLYKLDCVASSASYGSWTNVGSCGTYSPGNQYQSRTWTKTVTTAADCGGSACSLSGTEYQYITCGSCTPGNTQYNYCGTGACAASQLVTCTSAGEWPADCTPGLAGTESCNGVDDDCDYSTDEDLAAPSQSCNVGVGACLRTGTQYQTCQGTYGWSPYGTCSATAGTAGTETCNNIDDDCDGSIDEDLSASQSCTVGVGACLRTGTQTKTCSAGSWGSWGTCSAAVVSRTTETCNGIDDDCNGTIDNGVTRTHTPATCGTGYCVSNYTADTCVVNGTGTWTSGTCTAKTATTTCATLGYNCGTASDNCGGTLSCGSCTGTEKNYCKNNTCQDLCHDGLNNDGDSYTDTQESECGGCGSCTSGTCCDTTYGCYLPSTTLCSDCTPSASANSCSASCTQYKCTGSSSACGTSNPQTKTVYASSGYVYTGSGTTETAASCSNYCSVSAYACSGTTYYNTSVPYLSRSAYGCNGSGSCNTSSAAATCTQSCTYGCSGSMCNSSCPENCGNQLTSCGWWYMCSDSSPTWCGCDAGYDCTVNYPYPQESMGTCTGTITNPTCTPNCAGKQCGSGGCYDTPDSCGACPSTGYTCCDSVTWTCQKPANCTAEEAPVEELP